MTRRMQLQDSHFNLEWKEIIFVYTYNIHWYTYNIYIYIIYIQISEYTRYSSIHRLCKYCVFVCHNQYWLYYFYAMPALYICTFLIPGPVGDDDYEMDGLTWIIVHGIEKQRGRWWWEKEANQCVPKPSATLLSYKFSFQNHSNSTDRIFREPHSSGETTSQGSIAACLMQCASNAGCCWQQVGVWDHVFDFSPAAAPKSNRYNKSLIFPTVFDDTFKKSLIFFQWFLIILSINHWTLMICFSL